VNFPDVPERLWMSHEEWALFGTYADLLGLNPSQFCRHLLWIYHQDERLQKLVKEEAENSRREQE